MGARRSKLRGGCELGDSMAEMPEVVGADLEMQDLFDHRREVRQRADDPERRSIGGARQTPCGGKSQRVLDRLERHPALVQLDGEQTVGAADGAARAGSRSIGFQKPAYIIALLHWFNLADRAATGRRWSRYDSNAARGSAARPPSACYRESCATRHRPGWS